MAYVSYLRRLALPALLSTALTTCSVSDGLVPPANIDMGTKVSSISPTPRHAAMQMAPAEMQPSYPASGAPVSNSQGSIDYLDTPNLAGTGHSAQATSQPMPKKLPMIDSD